MKNFRAEDMPKGEASKITAGVETTPVKDKHSDQINAAAHSDDAASKTAEQVVAGSKEAKAEAKKGDQQPENDYDRNNAAEDAVADNTTARRKATGISKTEAKREAKKADQKDA